MLKLYIQSCCYSYFNELAFLRDICSNFLCIIPKRVFMNICEKSGLGTCNETQKILQKGFHLIDRNRLICFIQFLNATVGF